MRALVCYPGSPARLEVIAGAICKGLEKNGHSAELLNITNTLRPIPVSAYDLIIFGSASLGFFGGKISEDMAAFISKCSRLEAKKTAAFVTSGGFGTSKSLVSLMKVIEKQGSIVVDFATLSGERDAKAFGVRLKD